MQRVRNIRLPQTLKKREIPSVTRQSYELTEMEIKKFNKLFEVKNPKDGSHIFEFWNEAAIDRGLDPSTVIGTNNPLIFTALPIGHGKYWCFPIPIKCPPPPRDF